MIFDIIASFLVILLFIMVEGFKTVDKRPLFQEIILWSGFIAVLIAVWR